MPLINLDQEVRESVAEAHRSGQLKNEEIRKMTDQQLIAVGYRMEYVKVGAGTVSKVQSVMAERYYRGTKMHWGVHRAVLELDRRKQQRIGAAVEQKREVEARQQSLVDYDQN